MCSGCARLRQSMFCCYYKFLFAIIKSELRKCLRVLFRMISGIFADKFTHVSYAPHSPHHSTHTQHSHKWTCEVRIAAIVEENCRVTSLTCRTTEWDMVYCEHDRKPSMSMSIGFDTMKYVRSESKCRIAIGSESECNAILVLRYWNQYYEFHSR